MASNRISICLEPVTAAKRRDRSMMSRASIGRTWVFARSCPTSAFTVFTNWLSLTRMRPWGRCSGFFAIQPRSKWFRQRAAPHDQIGPRRMDIVQNAGIDAFPRHGDFVPVCAKRRGASIKRLSAVSQAGKGSDRRAQAVSGMAGRCRHPAGMHRVGGIAASSIVLPIKTISWRRSP